MKDRQTEKQTEIEIERERDWRGERDRVKRIETRNITKYRINIKSFGTSY